MLGERPVRRVLLHGVRPRREAPDLLGRARRPGRRLHAFGARAGAPCRRRRNPLGRRIHHAGDRASGRDARSADAAHDRSGAPGQRSADRHRHHRRQDVPLWIWRVEGLGAAPLYLLEPVVEHDRWINRRCTAAARTIAWRRRSCSASAACARCRRSASTSTSTTSTRGTRSSPGSSLWAGARARARFWRRVGRDARAHRVHHAHADRRRQRGARARAAAPARRDAAG